MRKILFIILVLSSVVAFGQSPKKDHFGVYNFRDTVYFNRVPYNSGAGIVHLGIDTVASSPTFGKLVRKTASAATPTLQQVFNTEVGGSVLTKNDSIITQSGNHFLTVQGNGTSTTIPTFEVKNTGSNGLAMQIGSSGKGLYINGASGGQTALEVDGYSTGFTAQLTANANGTVLYMNKYSSTNNAIATIPAMQTNRWISGGGTAAAGLGFSEDKNIQNTSGSGTTAVQHIYNWTTATASSETAQYIVKQKNAGSLLSTYFQNSGRTDTVATLYDVGKYHNRATAQTSANTNILGYAVGASDGTFQISANVLVTASATHSFTVTVDYTDEGNTTRTITLTFSQLAGTFITTITNVTGAAPYEGVPLTIRAKSGTDIVFKTAGTFTSVTYNVDANITQLN